MIHSSSNGHQRSWPVQRVARTVPGSAIHIHDSRGQYSSFTVEEPEAQGDEVTGARCTCDWQSQV